MDKKVFLITIDTEFSNHRDGMGVFGTIEGRDYGVSKFMEICNRYNLKANFFIDVYTQKKEYRSRFIEMCLKLKNMGHDLQLHTHPDGLFDKNRYCLAQYSLSEQVEIISTGKEIFKDWFGGYPIAHRAGDWGANEDTLNAVGENKVFIDSSMFYAWPNCKLSREIVTKNKPFEFNGVLEIPATVFQCCGLGLFAPYRLFSTDGNSYHEVMHVMKKIKESNMKIINMVFHSFSFLRWDSGRRHYSVSSNKIKKFDNLLNAISSDDSIELCTLSGIYKKYCEDPISILGTDDTIVSTGLKYLLPRCIDRMV